VSDQTEIPAGWYLDEHGCLSRVVSGGMSESTAQKAPTKPAMKGSVAYNTYMREYMRWWRFNRRSKNSGGLDEATLNAHLRP
jgi:hypothetical protein